MKEAMRSNLSVRKSHARKNDLHVFPDIIVAYYTKRKNLHDLRHRSIGLRLHQ